MIGVTGATGVVGGLVAAALADQGLAQTLLVRDPARAPQLPNAQVARAVYDTSAETEAALQGVDVLLMVSAAEAADRLDAHYAFVDAAARAGVQHVVYTSFLAAAADSTFTLGRDHFHTEQRIRSSGMDFTFLRDNLYLDFFPHFAGADGVIRGPAGDGRVSAVARADVARCALAALLDPDGHHDATYDLTGPEALSLQEAAALLTEVTGRSITFHNETVDEAYASRRAQWPAEDWQYDAWVSTYTAIASGELARVSEDVARLTGRPALSAREVLSAAG